MACFIIVHSHLRGYTFVKLVDCWLKLWGEKIVTLRDLSTPSRLVI